MKEFVIIDGGCHLLEMVATMFGKDGVPNRDDSWAREAPWDDPMFFRTPGVHPNNTEFHLFECNPALMPALTERIASFQVEYPGAELHLHEEALWTSDGTQPFYISCDIWGDVGSTLLPEKREKLDREHPVTVQTVDTAKFLQSFPGRYVIMKLDIEGGEYEILPHVIGQGVQASVKEYYLEWHPDFFPEKAGRQPQIEQALRATGAYGIIAATKPMDIATFNSIVDSPDSSFFCLMACLGTEPSIPSNWADFGDKEVGLAVRLAWYVMCNSKLTGHYGDCTKAACSCALCEFMTDHRAATKVLELCRQQFPSATTTRLAIQFVLTTEPKWPDASETSFYEKLVCMFDYEQRMRAFVAEPNPVGLEKVTALLDYFCRCKRLSEQELSEWWCEEKPGKVRPPILL